MIRQLYGKPNVIVRPLWGLSSPIARNYFTRSGVSLPSFSCRLYRNPQLSSLRHFTCRGALSSRTPHGLVPFENVSFSPKVQKRFQSGVDGADPGKAHPPPNVEGVKGGVENGNDGADFLRGAARAESNAGCGFEDPLHAPRSPSLYGVYPPSEVELPESTFLKCIEKEIMDEKLRLDKEDGPPAAPAGWELHHTDGTSFFYGRRRWVPPSTPPLASNAAASPPRRSPAKRRHVERHFLRVQLTTRDPSLDPECDIRGEHVPFSFFVQRVPFEEEEGGNGEGENSPFSRILTSTFHEDGELSLYQNSIEVRLDVIDGELVVDNVVFHGDHPVKGKGVIGNGEGERGSSTQGENSLGKEKELRAMYHNPFGGYPGPNLDEAEEEVLDGIQAWLAERHIDDLFGEFVGQYSVWIEQMEYERWLQQLYDYVAA